jgi:putative transcriptional regulator
VLDNKQIRFFAGYSGWEYQQLEREISENYWIVTEQDTKVLMFSNPKNVYNKVLSRLGEEYKIWANSPEDPAFN